MELPVLIINFKTYTQARGNKGMGLAKLAEDVADEYGVNIIVVPQLPDMISIAREVDIPVYAQHIDSLPSGSATGHIDGYTLKEGGIAGTLLNHSERRLEISRLEKSVQIATDLGLDSVVCAGTIGLSKSLSSLNPTAVAMEPPELIGGEVSVTTKPEIVEQAVNKIHAGNADVIPLVGAGVKNADHINKALELGAKGVLLASGVVKAENPRAVMIEMARVMTSFGT